MADQYLGDSRLVMRQEGVFVVALYARNDRLSDARIIGSISIDTSPERRTAFEALMADVVRDFVEERTGERPEGKGVG